MKDYAIQLEDKADVGSILDLKISVKKDNEGKILSGLCIGSTLEQNKALILIAQPNDFKDNPDLGVGIEDMLMSDDLLEFRHKIREEFAKDGLVIDELDLYSTKRINIEAHYE